MNRAPQPKQPSSPPRADRPAATVSVSLAGELLAALDAWIAQQPAPVSRPAAIRALLAERLAEGERGVTDWE